MEGFSSANSQNDMAYHEKDFEVRLGTEANSKRNIFNTIEKQAINQTHGHNKR